MKVGHVVWLGCLMLGAAVLSPPVRAAASGGPIGVVAAENFYGAVAARIGGDRVRVTSILSSPDQDPHLFEATPAAARQLADARIVISNGLGYDPWVASLLAAAPRPTRRTIVVATLRGKAAGDNPHLWYDPATMPALATALAQEFARIDPDHAVEYQRRLAAFLNDLAPMRAEIQELRRHYAGTAVTATEPVFGYMAAALGFAMRDRRFQLAVMNDTEPSAGDLARIEGDLEQHRVRLLFYNTQTQAPMAERLLSIARAAHVPVIGVSETEPAGKSYEQWMTGTLAAIAAALAGPAP